MLKRLIISLTFLVLIVSCEDNSKVDGSSSSKTEIPTSETTLPLDKVKTPSLRNWSQIKASRTIRAIKLKWEEELALPRSASTTQYHVELFEKFAQSNELEIQWVLAEDINQMFELLKTHQADVIPAHLTVIPERRKKFSFSRPLLLDKEVLITSSKNSNPEVQAIEVSLPAGSAYIDTATNSFPLWKVKVIEESLNSEKIADAINEGRIRYSILDEKSFNILAQYRKDVKSIKVLPKANELAWAVSLNNFSLLEKINVFIDQHHHIQAWDNKPRKRDFNVIKKEKLSLRMITRNSPETYFLWRGELMGFEYELIREFARRQNLRLDVIVADSYNEMLDLLEQGQGDFIAAGLSKTAKRKKNLTFSIRYNRVSEKLVAHNSSPLITGYPDLKNRTISVRKTSAFWPTAERLARYYGANLVAADEDISTEQLIAAVAEGEIDLTIADSNLLSIEQSFREEISTPLTLNENIPYAYIVRKENPQLLNALNKFIQQEYRKTFYNVVKNKYFSNRKIQKKHREERITADSRLSPYDQLVQDQSKQYNFDWRLIISQMYQESRFDPTARSAAGASGLMQVLPRTAREMGFDNLNEPEQSIAAGVRYLDWSRDRFSDNLAYEERILFALAAYNAGFGHVNDARRLAKQMNLRSDKWFGHVEKAMLLLQKPKYYKKARFGYVRGSEPVKYVRDIHQRYLSYLAIAE